MDVNFNDDMEAGPTVTYTDKDSKVITRQEIDDYSAWLEANPAPVVSTVEETLTL